VASSVASQFYSDGLRLAGGVVRVFVTICQFIRFFVAKCWANSRFPETFIQILEMLPNALILQAFSMPGHQ
jgi:hypothetical protein